MRHALHPLPYRRSFGFGFGPSVDSIFNDLVRQFNEPTFKGEWNDDGLTLTVDLPGVAADGISLSIADRVLTISVEELDWKRSFRLRSNLDADTITARHLDGRLTVRVGVTAAPEARTIDIETTAPAAEAIEVSSEQSGGDSTDAS